MKDLDEFLPGILPYAPGCPAPTAYFGIRQAAIEFCERTKLWRFEDESAITEASDRMAAPAGSVVHEIELARFDGKDLTPKTAKQLDEKYDGWREGTITGQPSYITQTEPGYFRVVPFQAGTLRLAVWLKPSQDADSLPDFLLDEFREVISYGALSRILMIPNQSFTSVEMGAGLGSLFQSKVAALATRGIIGQQRATVRSKASFL